MSTKIKLHIAMINEADGSASIVFAKSHKLANIYLRYNQLFEPGGEVKSHEFEFDDDGELMDEYCVDVKERLLEVIDTPARTKADLQYKRACKQLLKELEEE